MLAEDGHRSRSVIRVVDPRADRSPSICGWQRRLPHRSPHADHLVLNAPVSAVFRAGCDWSSPRNLPPGHGLGRPGVPGPGRGLAGVGGRMSFPARAGAPGYALGPLPLRMGQGETAAPKMSELPNVAGQSVCGAGRVPSCRCAGTAATRPGPGSQRRCGRRSRRRPRRCGWRRCIRSRRGTPRSGRSATMRAGHRPRRGPACRTRRSSRRSRRRARSRRPGPAGNWCRCGTGW